MSSTKHSRHIRPCTWAWACTWASIHPQNPQTPHTPAFQHACTHATCTHTARVHTDNQTHALLTLTHTHSVTLQLQMHTHTFTHQHQKVATPANRYISLTGRKTDLMNGRWTKAMDRNPLFCPLPHIPRHGTLKWWTGLARFSVGLGRNLHFRWNPNEFICHMGVFNHEIDNDEPRDGKGVFQGSFELVVTTKVAPKTS